MLCFRCLGVSLRRPFLPRRCSTTVRARCTLPSSALCAPHARSTWNCPLASRLQQADRRRHFQTQAAATEKANSSTAAPKSLAVDYTILAACAQELQTGWSPAKVEQVMIMEICTITASQLLDQSCFKSANGGVTCVGHEPKAFLMRPLWHCTGSNNESNAIALVFCTRWHQVLHH